MKKGKFMVLPGCIIVVALIFLVNFSQPFSTFDKHIQAVLVSKDSPLAHLALAEDFAVNNQISEAKKELETLKSFPPEETVLLQSDLQELRRLTSSKRLLQKNVLQLERQQENFPHYRDLLLQEALFLWQLKQDGPAQEISTEAFFLDPNNVAVKRVGQLIN